MLQKTITPEQTKEILGYNPTEKFNDYVRDTVYPGSLDPVWFAVAQTALYFSRPITGAPSSQRIPMMSAVIYDNAMLQHTFTYEQVSVLANALESCSTWELAHGAEVGHTLQDVNHAFLTNELLIKGWNDDIEAVRTVIDKEAADIYNTKMQEAYQRNLAEKQLKNRSRKVRKANTIAKA